MRNIVYILILVSYACIISCSGMDEQYYKISFIINEDISDHIDIAVKSAAESEVTPEQIDAFTLWVDGTKIGGTYGSIRNETYKLKVGAYTAHAENCTAEYAEANPDSYGCVRYYGATEFEVKTLETTQNVGIDCSIANARVAVVLTEDFSSYFVADETSVRISDSQDFSSRALPMITSGAQVSGETLRTAYFTAGDTVYAEVTTRKAGADRTVTYRVPIINGTLASTSYTVSLSVNEDSTTGGVTFIVNGSGMTVNDYLSIESYVPVEEGNFTEDK